MINTQQSVIKNMSGCRNCHQQLRKLNTETRSKVLS